MLPFNLDKFLSWKSEIHTLMSEQWNTRFEKLQTTFCKEFHRFQIIGTLLWLKYILITIFIWILLFNLHAAQHMLCILKQIVQKFKFYIFFSLICRLFCTEIVKLFVWITFCYFWSRLIFPAILFFSSVFVVVVICDRMRFANDGRKQKKVWNFAIEKRVCIDWASANSPPKIGNLSLRNWWQCIKISQPVDRGSVCVRCNIFRTWIVFCNHGRLYAYECMKLKRHECCWDEWRRWSRQALGVVAVFLNEL